MAFKTVVFACLLVALLAVQTSEAQTLVNGLLAALTGVIRVQGTVFCTINGTVVIGGPIAAPVLPNATVQLQCRNATIATVTATNSGTFSFLLDPLHFITSSVQSGCRAVVTTPLANCNASLPSTGNLISSLQSLPATVSGLLPIPNLGAVNFTLVI